MNRSAGEPDLGPWSSLAVGAVADDLLSLARSRRAGSAWTGPIVLAVNGRSAGGKSTVAGRLADAIDRSVVVQTDDFAWHHSFFD
jgi:hypothetical protein